MRYWLTVMRFSMMTTMMMAGAASQWVVGCGQSPGEPEPAEPRGAEVQPAEDLRARPPSRGRVWGGEAMRRTVKWPDDAKRVIASYEALDGPSREAVDAAPVPVLVPDLGVQLDQRKVMTGPEWASFWGQRDGMTVSVHASRMARVFAGVRPTPGTHTVREHEGFITRNEGIWAASWIEHGVAYDLQLECAPVDAPECVDSTTLEALADGLTYVGGRGAEVTR